MGIHTDLFDLGLNSIQVMNLVYEAEEKGINISVAEVYKNRTIHQILSQRMGDPLAFWYHTPQGNKPILLIVSGYPPFYALYRHFAELLSEHFDIWVFESYNDLFFHKPCSFDRMMQYYMDNLRPLLRKQPLAAVTGLCFGGELALQLANWIAEEINALIDRGVNYKEIARALDKSILRIEDGVMETLSQTPPELAADIYNTGIYMAGGGSMLRGLDQRISKKTGLPVFLADDPLRAVVRGTGIALKNIDKFTFLMK